MALGQGECFGSVVAEVVPGSFVEFAGDAQAVQVGADQVFGASSEPVSTMTQVLM